jgi:hypothetical protein
MIAGYRIVRRLSLLDIPAVLTTDNLLSILPGKDRYGFHAVLLVLMAFSASISRDAASALRFLALSESVMEGLYIQRMCRVWLGFMDESAGESGADSPADLADQAIAEMAARLKSEKKAGIVMSCFRPVQTVDRMLAVKWMPFLSLAISSRRESMTPEMFARCTAAYQVSRSMTLATEVVDLLYFPSATSTPCSAATWRTPARSRWHGRISVPKAERRTLRDSCS